MPFLSLREPADRSTGVASACPALPLCYDADRGVCPLGSAARPARYPTAPGPFRARPDGVAATRRSARDRRGLRPDRRTGGHPRSRRQRRRPPSTRSRSRACGASVPDRASSTTASNAAMASSRDVRAAAADCRGRDLSADAGRRVDGDLSEAATPPPGASPSPRGPSRAAPVTARRHPGLWASRPAACFSEAGDRAPEPPAAEDAQQRGAGRPPAVTTPGRCRSPRRYPISPGSPSARCRPSPTSRRSSSSAVSRRRSTPSSSATTTSSARAAGSRAASGPASSSAPTATS